MNALKNGLTLGSMFCLLAALCASPLPAADPVQGAYTVAKGDCLWTIAGRKDVFGDPWKWPLLLEANRGRINDPDLIQPGWTLAVTASPSPDQIARALDFARDYKEEAVAGEQAPVMPEAAPPAQAPPPVPAQEQKQGAALPVASVFLVVALIAGVVYRKMKHDPDAGTGATDRIVVDEPAEERKIVAGPAPSPGQPERAAESAPVAEAQPRPAEPAVTAEPSAAAPTESETLVRAEQGPDPLHPEDHQHAA